MRRLVLAVGIALTALWPVYALGESSCPERLAELRNFLDRSIIILEREVEHARGDTILSEGTRGELVQSGEWVIAWLRDQTMRLADVRECEGLPEQQSSIRAQLLPLALLSLHADVSRFAWELDRLSHALDEEIALLAPEHQADSLAAKALFVSARALLAGLDGATVREELRVPLRRAAALTRQGLRILRIHGILE